MKKPTIVFFIMLLVIVGGFLYYREGILPVNQKQPSSKIFIIEPGTPLNTIAKNLANEGFIRNRLIFFLVVKKLGLERKIQAGDFRLSTDMDAYQIANALTHGTLDIWVTLIEGTRKEEMAQIISQKFNIPESEFINNAREGYLFPDTYLIPREATAGSVIKILENNFNNKFDLQLKQKINRLGLTTNQALILASLVEKEAKFDNDMQIVAGILLKRLKNDWPLQVDATIQYALGYQSEDKTWWKKELSLDDLEIDSPYNTYKNKGLPPTAIANPGINSIKSVAAANANTPFWFYLTDKNGKMHYAETIEEHDENVSKYLQ
ncbi:MAG: Aminodeoxychorismate lyase [Candidatus Roizmanbacteria bacterium GW2011_GWA2_36_23]|uniref:Endolytic murein transglycosylase n=1 Tax=Candidatus Roizmanbacteria bacterium GW2011_GWA2_36_23 TaxID=1618480 RepID=A0A0G0E8R8_9BACT|nr:MAG: Aminodeoxychorismate lyase [Candidatus Roizmanbacteria bacterium GW2011_GWA2_36_23]